MRDFNTTSSNSSDQDKLVIFVINDKKNDLKKELGFNQTINEIILTVGDSSPPSNYIHKNDENIQRTCH